MKTNTLNPNTILKPGTWVRWRGDKQPKRLLLIVHFATYVDHEYGRNYFFYAFTPKGNFIEGAWGNRKAFCKIQAPAFAKDIIVFPELLQPITKEDKREGIFRGGIIYTKKNLVVIDTMKVASKVLADYIISPFKDVDMWVNKHAASCDGAVYDKRSWIAAEQRAFPSYLNEISK